jgi:hypothetical protein
MGRGRPVGRFCCGCTGNLDEPDVKAVLCIGGNAISVECECECHPAVREHRHRIDKEK